jgi:anthranilate synthase component 2
MKILVLDNYDSFTYNLVYILRQEAIEVDVIRNDKITAEEAQKYDGILLSPGPGIPEEAGNMPQIIEECCGKTPMLGICLGHQAIAEYLGAHLINRDEVLHGMQTPILKTPHYSDILEGIEDTFLAGRYHSWEVSMKKLPEEIKVTAIDEDGSIMALEHDEKSLYGLQFHPESVMTLTGTRMIKNFIQICKNHRL